MPFNAKTPRCKIQRGAGAYAILLGCAGGAAGAGGTVGVLLGPDAVSRGSPLVGIGAAAAEHIIRRFRLLHIGAVGTAALDHLTQQLGVFKHRAGAQVVVVEGLALVVFLEQRLLQALEQALVVDVGVGVVDEDARFCIARRIDMEIVASACDASAHKLAIVLTPLY